MANSALNTHQGWIDQDFRKFYNNSTPFSVTRDPLPSPSSRVGQWLAFQEAYSQSKGLRDVEFTPPLVELRGRDSSARHQSTAEPGRHSRALGRRSPEPLPVSPVALAKPGKRKFSYNGNRDEEPSVPEPRRSLLDRGLKKPLNRYTSPETLDCIVVAPLPDPTPAKKTKKSQPARKTKQSHPARKTKQSQPPAKKVQHVHRLPPLRPQTPTQQPETQPETQLQPQTQTPTEPETPLEPQRKRQKQQHSPKLATQSPPPSQRHADVAEPSTEEINEVLNSVQPQASHFFMLAPEVRDKIYRHLLVSQKPVQVKNLWTEVVPYTTRPKRSCRGRRDRQDGGRGNQLSEEISVKWNNIVDTDTGDRIDTRILRVCRQAAYEGARVLYSENKFLYLLRDPPATIGLSSSPSSSPPSSPVPQGKRYRHVHSAGEQHRTSFDGRLMINVAKYGHLFRHLALELEPNRSGPEYLRLMEWALKALVNPTIPLQSRPGSPPPRSCRASQNKNIFLDTLTITTTPFYEYNQRMRGELEEDDDDIDSDLDIHSGNEDQRIPGRYWSVVNLFGKGTRVMKALERIDTNFLRLNVHVLANPPTPFDDEDYNAGAKKVEQARWRHLEATLDLRYLPRHMNALARDDLLGCTMWTNDVLVDKQRAERGRLAQEGLARLRRSVKEVCLETDKAVADGGFWEDHDVAEARRREIQEKHERTFEGGEGAAQLFSLNMNTEMT